MSKTLTFLYSLVVIQLVRSDRVKLRADFAEIDVPCRWRYGVYKSHMNHILALHDDITEKLKSLETSSQYGIVREWLTRGRHFQALAVILDSVLNKRIINDYAYSISCQNFKREMVQQCAMREHSVNQHQESAVSQNNDELRLSSVLPQDLLMTVPLKPDCPEKSYFQLILEYIHLEVATPDNNSNSSLCEQVSQTSADYNYKRNLLNIKALMFPELELEAKIYANTLRNTINKLVNDFLLVRRVFFSKYKSVNLYQISATSGDSHKETGNVVILTFDCRHAMTPDVPRLRKIVYKPSTVLIDWLINGETRYFCKNALSNQQQSTVEEIHSQDADEYDEQEKREDPN